MITVSGSVLTRRCDTRRCWEQGYSSLGSDLVIIGVDTYQRHIDIETVAHELSFNSPSSFCCLRCCVGC